MAFLSNLFLSVNCYDSSDSEVSTDLDEDAASPHSSEESAQVGDGDVVSLVTTAPLHIPVDVSQSQMLPHDDDDLLALQIHTSHWDLIMEVIHHFDRSERNQQEEWVAVTYALALNSLGRRDLTFHLCNIDRLLEDFADLWQDQTVGH